MSVTINKIGLIQNAPLPGDFPANLRAIVQGYRDCIDHGAELVIAPAAALCGAEPRSLMNRRSFISQMKAAMDALSHELGTAPLLLGGYAALIDEDEMWDGQLADNDYFDESMDPEPNVLLVPFLIERDMVTELEDGEVADIDGTQVYVTIGDDELLPEGSDFDIMVHLSLTPWYSGSVAKAEEARRWEATNNGAAVVCCRAVGTAGQKIFGGGSCVLAADGSVRLRLPFFETAAKTATLRSKMVAPALPEEEALLQQALERGIRDTVRNNGYSGVLVPQDFANSTLLTALAASALGSGNVCAITFEGNEATAKALHTDCLSYDAADLCTAAADTLKQGTASPALAARLKATLMMTLAEERGLMLLSPLDRHSIMTGGFTLYGDSCGFLAPLANLYEMDVYLLSKRFAEQHAGLFGTLAEPAHPEQDRIIHELADRNVSAGELLRRHELLFRENDVRLLQRRIIASELKRTQLPIVLHVDAPEEQLRFPVSHRLND